jgi:hypothetical protein
VESVTRNHAIAEPRPGYWARFRSAPIILQAYLVFAIGAVALAMSVFYARPLHAAIIPFTGGGMMLYAFTLYFAISAILTRQRKAVYAVVILVGLLVVTGVIELTSHLAGSDEVRQGFNNPYLTYSAYRPIVTVTLPTAWLLLLVSPSMRRWIRNPSEENPAPGRRQASVMDLLYAMLVVAVCLATSLTLVRVVELRDPWLVTPPAAAPVSTTPGQGSVVK